LRQRLAELVATREGDVLAKFVFLTPCSADVQSAVHRVTYMEEQLSIQGHSTQTFFGKRGALAGHPYTRVTLGAVVRCLCALRDTDVLVVHRAGDPISALLARIHKRLRGTLVFDIDDAVYLRWNILTTSVPEIVSMSDIVLVGSHTIADYCQRWNQNVHILPSGADTSLFHPNARTRSDHELTIGWMGDGRVHGENLELLLEPLLALAKERRFRLKLVSSLGSPVIRDAFARLARQVDVDFGSPHWMDISAIPRMIRDFDISVMPLLDNEFNRAKWKSRLLPAEWAKTGT